MSETVWVLRDSACAIVGASARDAYWAFQDYLNTISPPRHQARHMEVIEACLDAVSGKPIRHGYTLEPLAPVVANSATTANCAPLTDAECDAIIEALDRIARDFDDDRFGLPIRNEALWEKMRDALHSLRTGGGGDG